MTADKKRVVVTGLGLVTPLGLTREETWKNLLAGRSGVKPVTLFDVSQYTTRISAPVVNFDVTPFLSVKEARKLDTFIQYGVAAANEAMRDAGLAQPNPLHPERYGVAVGSGIGGLPKIEENHTALMNQGPRRISPFFIPGSIINMLAGELSIIYGWQGPNLALVTACTTGAHNMGVAARLIACGDVDVMLAGGAEMATCPLGLGGFAAMRALSTRNDEPEKASRPWDKDRDGFVLGDGAGMVVLESYEHAVKRGAKIYAELVGVGMSGDAYHMTMPHPEGLGGHLAMQAALRDAKVGPDVVDYINAHATSTPAGDELEAAAIVSTFGSHAKGLAVSSTKSMTGHLLGAAGAVEAVFCILALRDQVAPPTINLDNPSIDCGLDFVPNHAKSMKIEFALSNSFGFGGTNGALLFKRLSA
ncbi:MAG: beta-ketoacyl-ACP synthase II [Gammaproteobacteria bacterium]|nr:beta-ketoacyl-ACP synthase II [Gammaproteobacteria bacterium]